MKVHFQPDYLGYPMCGSKSVVCSGWKEDVTCKKCLTYIMKVGVPVNVFKKEK